MHVSSCTCLVQYVSRRDMHLVSIHPYRTWLLPYMCTTRHVSRIDTRISYNMYRNMLYETCALRGMYLIERMSKHMSYACCHHCRIYTSYSQIHMLYSMNIYTCRFEPLPPLSPTLCAAFPVQIHMWYFQVYVSHTHKYTCHILASSSDTHIIQSQIHIIYVPCEYLHVSVRTCCRSRTLSKSLEYMTYIFIFQYTFQILKYPCHILKYTCYILINCK